MDNNTLIKDIILSQKDFELLPRDKDGYCVYYGDLYLINKLLKIIPNKLIVNGNLYCSYNKLENLPDNLKVSGSLSCNDNQLESLPDGLVVKKDLNCSYNQLTSLPDNLNIGNNLFCDNNYITTEIKCQIGGNITMDDEQERTYNRSIKINKLKSLIDE